MQFEQTKGYKQGLRGNALTSALLTEAISVGLSRSETVTLLQAAQSLSLDRYTQANRIADQLMREISPITDAIGSLLGND
jgi:hypothetical protein